MTDNALSHVLLHLPTQWHWSVSHRLKESVRAKNLLCILTPVEVFLITKVCSAVGHCSYHFGEHHCLFIYELFLRTLSLRLWQCLLSISQYTQLLPWHLRYPSHHLCGRWINTPHLKDVCTRIIPKENEHYPLRGSKCRGSGRWKPLDYLKAQMAEGQGLADNSKTPIEHHSEPPGQPYH